MCLDGGLQGLGSIKPSFTPLMATPWARTANTDSGDHDSIKSQYRGTKDDTKPIFTYTGQLAGSAE